MAIDSQQTSEHGMGQTDKTEILAFDRQRLRILRCTAQAMASSPGGLRFKAGTRPWLEGLSAGRPEVAAMMSQRMKALAQPTVD